jgi:hypothetical protein
MTDFFDDLERELRRAHRRDTEREARSGVFDRWRPPAFPAPGPRTLVALAAVAWLVAVVLVVGRNSDAERQSAAPQPSPTTALGEGGCDPSDWWTAPVVDEPIPRAIASRFAIFRDRRPNGQLPPGDVLIFEQTRKQYGNALTLRPRLDTGARLRVIRIAAADVTNPQPDRDWCAPPPGPIMPGICVAATASKREHGGRCFSIDEIENAEAWFEVTRQTVVGLAPDGVDRVAFDTPEGTQSLNIGENVFAGEIRSADNPVDTDTRFTP